MRSRFCLFIFVLVSFGIQNHVSELLSKRVSWYRTPSPGCTGAARCTGWISQGALASPPSPTPALALATMLLPSIPSLNLCGALLSGTETCRLIPNPGLGRWSAHPLSVICTCRGVYFFSQEEHAEKDILLITN